MEVGYYKHLIEVKGNFLRTLTVYGFAHLNSLSKILILVFFIARKWCNCYLYGKYLNMLIGLWPQNVRRDSTIFVIPRVTQIPDVLHSLMQWKLNSVHSIQSTEMQNQNRKKVTYFVEFTVLFSILSSTWLSLVHIFCHNTRATN